MISNPVGESIIRSLDLGESVMISNLMEKFTVKILQVREKGKTAYDSEFIGEVTTDLLIPRDYGKGDMVRFTGYHVYIPNEEPSKVWDLKVEMLDDEN